MACGGCEAPPPRPREPQALLIEKGRYQVLYRADRTRERLVYDGDGDGRAEAVMLYSAAGTLDHSEIDTDSDGRVDRWEYFDETGRLVRVDRAAPR